MERDERQYYKDGFEVVQLQWRYGNTNTSFTFFACSGVIQVFRCYLHVTTS